MIRFRTRHALPAVALALAACAEKPLGPPFEGSADGAHLNTAARQQVSPEPPKNQQPARIISQGKVSSISLEQFFALHQSGKALVFDARPGFFYHLGHIPRAIHLPRQSGDGPIRKLETEIKTALSAGKTIVVYCSGLNCPDALAVATQLSRLGHSSTVFSGGWDAWKEADMPTE